MPGTRNEQDKCDRTGSIRFSAISFVASSLVTQCRFRIDISQPDDVEMVGISSWIWINIAITATQCPIQTYVTPPPLQSSMNFIFAYINLLESRQKAMFWESRMEVHSSRDNQQEEQKYAARGKGHVPPVLIGTDRARTGNQSRTMQSLPKTRQRKHGGALRRKPN